MNLFKSKFFFISFILLIIIAILHLISIKFNLYITISWIDTLIHFIAGVCISFGYLYSIEDLLKVPTLSNYKVLITGLIMVFIVGIIWEIFEYTFDLSFSWLIDYPIDTATDLIADICGAVIPFLFLTNKENMIPAPLSNENNLENNTNE